MMKRAIEIAELAAAARAAKKEDEKSELANREAKERVDQAHGIFESQALAAAGAGHVSMAFTSAELSLDRLWEQGFQAERLMRRESFEQHLEALVNTKSKQLVIVCERILSVHPILARVEGEDFLHRNPLVSLLETLWRRGELNKPFDVEMLLAFARIQKDLEPSDLRAVSPQIEQAMQLFLEFKATESKYQRVRWENLVIPKDANQATYVTWESADDGQGLQFHFSASRLKWLAVTWPQLATWVGTFIEEAARSGQSELTQFVWITTGAWIISQDWPPDAMTDDDDPDIEDQKVGANSTWGGGIFCHPKLAAEALTMAGFEVTIMPIKINTASELSYAEECISIHGGEAYSLTIAWQ